MQRLFLVMSFVLGLMMCNHVLGQDWLIVGDSLKALKLYESAIKAYESSGLENGNDIDKNDLWSRLAECHMNAGNYQQAISYYERMLEILDDDIPEGLEKAFAKRKNRLLLNISGLLLNTGQFEKVISTLENMELDEGEAVRLVNLSSAYLRLNRPERALDVLDSAISRKDIDKESQTYRIALQNKGYILWALKRYNEAYTILNQTLSLYKEASMDKYICQGNLAIIEAELGQYSEALLHIDEAIAWVGSHYGIDNMDYIILVRKKAEILLKEGDKKEATIAFKEYFDLEKLYIIDNFLCMTETERQNFWNTHGPLLTECFATEDTDCEFLFDVSLFIKSVLMLTNLKIEQLVSSDNALISKYSELKSLRLKYGNDSLAEKSKDAAKADKLERELVSHLAQIGEFKESLSRTASKVKSSLKDNEYAVDFIQYQKANNTYYAALVMGKSIPVKFVPLFSMNDIKKHLVESDMNADDLYSMSVWTKDKLLNDTVLGRMIWDATLENIPRNANIYFSPDGIFHMLGIEYMCFDRPNSRFYRLSSLGNLCNASKRRKKYDTALLVGGLDYDDDSKVQHHKGQSPERIQSSILAQGGIDTSRGNIFVALIGSSAEIDSVATILRNKACRILTKDIGTEDTVKTEMPKKDVLFISTHGFCLDYTEAERSVFARDSISEDVTLSKSGLAMSGANKCIRPNKANENIEDGIITAKEVCDMNLSDADLVVLSACQTGLGRATIDGVVGLPRGFKKAGANSLLMSLWEVDDAATQLLMTKFMENITKGKTKHESLSDAQKYVREYQRNETKDINNNLTPRQRRRIQHQGISIEPQIVTRVTRPYSSPRYWAAFILLDAID